MVDIVDRLKKSLGVPHPTTIEFIDLDGEPSTLVFDCTTSINTTASSKVTQFPVESGRSTISDHTIKSPLKLALKGVISESPPTPLYNIGKAAIARGTTALKPNSKTAVGNAFLQAAVASGIALGVGSGVDRMLNTDYSDEGQGTIMSQLQDRKQFDFTYPKRAMIALKQLSDYGLPITVRTFFNDSMYSSMVIETVSFSQDAKGGDSLFFSMNLVKVQVVEVKVEERDYIAKSEGKTKPPHNSSAASKKKKGEVGTHDKTSIANAVNQGFDSIRNANWSDVITN